MEYDLNSAFSHFFISSEISKLREDSSHVLPTCRQVWFGRLAGYILEVVVVVLDRDGRELCRDKVTFFFFLSLSLSEGASG